MRTRTPKRPGADGDDESELPWLTRRVERMELPPSTVEYGVTIAASLAQHFLQSDREVGFLSYAEEREIVQPDRGERQLHAVARNPRGHPGARPAADCRSVSARRRGAGPPHDADRHHALDRRPLGDGAARPAARGVHGVAVLLAGRTFGPAPDWAPTLADLQASGLPAYLVKNGDELAEALGRLASGVGPRTIPMR